MWYNKHARLCELKPGNLVLVLLPTSTSKLLAQWQRPYKVVKRMSKVTYLIEMDDETKRRRVFHDNMLREFQVHKVVGSNCYADSVTKENEEKEVPLWDDDAPGGQPVFKEQLDGEKSWRNVSLCMVRHL